MTKAEREQIKTDAYRKGASDARLGIWNPDGVRYRNSKTYRDAYGQARVDHHKVGPAPLEDAPHLRPVLES